jgi:hypothetical protein
MKVTNECETTGQQILDHGSARGEHSGRWGVDGRTTEEESNIKTKLGRRYRKEGEHPTETKYR